MKTNELELDSVRKSVREHYGEVASHGRSCGCAPTSCRPSQSGQPRNPAAISRAVGYSAEDVGSVPDGANLGLGCGNPVALASLRPGQTVLDLGSGAGFDAFLAAKAVGPRGLVIGVDMTPEMITKAQQEMAARLGISLSGAKSRVQRGREQLKQMLLERCEFEFDRLGRIIDCKPRTKAACQECA